MRSRPYEERRALMLYVVAGLPEGSPIQAVSATEDVEVARVWYETLAGSGVEGVVAKSGRSPYRAGRSSSWKKVRHAETIDAEVVGFTGTAGRLRRWRCGCLTAVLHCLSGSGRSWPRKSRRRWSTLPRPREVGRPEASRSRRRSPDYSLRCCRGRRGMR
ncbi:ATP-dependent DNA ligase [Streptomyces sp. enrichment culture]|uniref:ATP-dependent DNA ligase n=1 Tax=Streptomyces sp. enrichment culture TaxID=1795815 RepID=UPI003F55EFB8